MDPENKIDDAPDTTDDFQTEIDGETDDPGYDTVDEFDMTADDALAIILSARPIHQTRRVGIPKRTGMGAITVTLRSLTDREFKMLRKSSEKPTGKKGALEIDDSLFIRNVVAAAIEQPKIGSIEVLQALGVKRPYEAVDRLFLPGRIGQLAEAVMELSGWDEQGLLDVNGEYKDVETF